MSKNTDAVLEVARGIMDAAGCASLVTVDESGFPSSRPVRTFPRDDEFTEITIPSDVNSRKTRHAAANPRVLLSYVDAPSRGYVTIMGNAEVTDSPERKRAAWIGPFAAFWPDGPDSEDHVLIVVTPERIETRSYTQGVADVPTHWDPVVLTRADGGRWRQDGG